MDELLNQISQNPDHIDTLDKAGLMEAVDVLTAYISEKALAISEGKSDNATADLAAAKEARERLTQAQDKLHSIVEAEEAVIAEAKSLLPQVEVVETPEVVEVPAEAPAEEPALVAAKPSIGAIAKRKPRDMDPPKVEQPSALVASLADGSPVNSGLDLAKAMIAQNKKLGSLRPAGRTSYPIAQFDFDHGAEVFNEDRDYNVIETVKDTEVLRVQGNIDRALGRPLSSLVAAIPVPCGPTEPIYTLFSISTRDGLLQVPTVNARRGSLSYPVSPSQVDIGATAAWENAIAEPWDDAAPKPFYLVDCPENEICTVVPYPTRLRFRNWEQRFNPEYVAHVMAESLTFGAHRMNATQIAAIRTLASNTAITGLGSSAAIISIANRLAFAAAKYRDTFKMGQDAPLTVLAPFWVRDSLAVDLMTRASTLSLENARARATALFAGFNLDVQWLYDTQTIAGNTVGATGAQAFPGTADFTIYAPGTFVRLDGGGLTIAETRDSTLNGLNQFEFFMETSEVICQVGHAAWDILGVPVEPCGQTGAPEELCGAIS